MTERVYKVVLIVAVILLILGLGFISNANKNMSLNTPDVWTSVHNFRITTTYTTRFQFPNTQAGAYTFTNFTATDTLYIGDANVNKNNGFPILPNQSMTVTPSANTNSMYGKFNNGTSGDIRGLSFK